MIDRLELEFPWPRSIGSAGVRLAGSFTRSRHLIAANHKSDRAVLCLRAKHNLTRNKVRLVATQRQDPYPTAGPLEWAA